MTEKAFHKVPRLVALTSAVVLAFLAPLTFGAGDEGKTKFDPALKGRLKAAITRADAERAGSRR